MQLNELFIDPTIYNETENPIHAWASLVACLENGKFEDLPDTVREYFLRAGNALIFKESPEKLGKSLANALELSNKSQLAAVRDELELTQEQAKIYDVMLSQGETIAITEENGFLMERSKPDISQNQALRTLNLSQQGDEDKTRLAKRKKALDRITRRFEMVFKK